MIESLASQQTALREALGDEAQALIREIEGFDFEPALIRVRRLLAEASLEQTTPRESEV